jgi:hypothetical protein
MGLDTSHDCWHGPYSSFNLWRTALADAIGVKLMSMDGFTDNGIDWATVPADPLNILLMHSDCDGHIDVGDLIPIAERLESVAVIFDKDDEKYPAEHRHWLGNGARARTFAAGLRKAAALGERVEFH